MADTRLPTDLVILEAIYDRYRETFANFTEGGTNSRQTKMYVPI